jgi:uncharacterized protein with von Willebrand factor type A (vWA) domain
VNAASPRQPDLAVLATGFARSLRAAGLRTPPSATLAFAEALTLVGLDRPEVVYWAGRASFGIGPSEAAVYDVTFSSYFGRRLSELTGGRLTTVPPTPAEGTAEVDAEGAGDDGGGPRRDRRTVVASSPTEVLRTKDFAACTPAELGEAARLVGELRRSDPTRRGRRPVPTARRGTGRPDVRRTVRAAMVCGGDPARILRLGPGRRPRRVLLLLDVSGSMQPYARTLLRYAHASVVARPSVEVFALGTRCTRITRALSWRDADAALARVAAATPDLEGGTRLGDVIGDFNEGWGVAGLARGATVVVVSDGWDRGDPAVVSEEMTRLARVAHRIVWVNPLKASKGYEPLARGMAAALPYVDEFVSGHSIDALQELSGVIDR